METLKKKRGVVRSVITRLINEMRTTMNQLPAQQGELEDKITRLTLNEKSLRELDMLIADPVDENNIEEEMHSILAYEDSISIARSRALREFQKLQPKNNETTTSASNNASHSERHRVNSATVPNVKLQKLEVPKFNEELAEWQTFWDQFQSSIDQNPVLSPGNKLKYLKVHLVGKAETLIKGMAVIGDNYDTAIELLKKRFGQPPLIVNDHLIHLLNIK
ncbi:uncharacterized protein LOC120842883 [Ixodes scapularis]|uniref:uncharacterized protein LOC120842883 n=1 Tax=Ixodes scapularis TaxID=6945 RepID=UPI001A9ED162|nr:uncharacterized protein LOC120842883 [Ixodes scapularis]